MSKFFLLLILFLFTVSCSKSSSNNDFSYDLIPVEVDGKWGYIDESGEYIINPQFTIAQLFKEDLAVVANEDSLLGYIDRKGNYIIKPTFLWATNFSDGLAFTTERNGFITCIDKSGTVQFTLKDAELAREFSEGLAVVKVVNKFGYIDKKGKFIIEPQFDYSENFKDGLAVVGKNNDKTGDDFSNMIYGFIDRNGQLVINYQFNSAESFSEGLATVSIADNKYGVIDKNGKYIITPKYGYVLPFKQGLAAFTLTQDGGESNNRGFLDKNGKIIINPQYSESGNFKQSLAPVRSDGNYGYIDTKGILVINSQFKNAGDFFSNLAPVKMGDKIGFINDKGTYVIPPQFTRTFPLAFFNTFLGFNGLYRGNFDFVESDFFDTSKVINELFKLSNNVGPFGLYKSEKLQDVLKNNVFGNFKYSSDPTQITNNEVGIFLTPDILITNVMMSFDKFVYLNNSQTSDFNFYNFQRGAERVINNNAKLSYVEVDIQLVKSAFNKEKVIAESIQKELQKRYSISTIYDTKTKRLQGVGVDNLEISFNFNSIENTFD